MSPTKTLNRDVAPIGDDIEPVGESRAVVEIGNEEDEEPLEAEIPRTRMNPKNPTSRERSQNMKIQDMLTGVGVLLVLKVEVQENADTFPIWFVETAGMVKRERHVVNGKVPQHTPFHFLVVSSKILVFS